MEGRDDTLRLKRQYIDSDKSEVYIVIITGNLGNTELHTNMIVVKFA